MLAARLALVHLWLNSRRHAGASRGDISSCRWPPLMMTRRSQRWIRLKRSCPDGLFAASCNRRACRLWRRAPACAATAVGLLYIEVAAAHCRGTMRNALAVGSRHRAMADLVSAANPRLRSQRPSRIALPISTQFRSRAFSPSELLSLSLTFLWDGGSGSAGDGDVGVDAVFSEDRVLVMRMKRALSWNSGMVWAPI